MDNRTKQPEGCIGMSEKCVFASNSLSSGNLSVFFLAIVVLLRLNKLAFERLLQEELSVKVVLKSSL